MITLENINKTFYTSEVETRALEDINLTVEKGEFVAIMGPSRSRWRWGRTCGSIWGSYAPPTVCLPLGRRQKRIDATGRRYGYGRTKKILGGQALRFLYQQGVRILPLPPGAGGDGVQLPVLLLPALYAGAEVRGKLHLFGKRRQGL